MTDDEKKQSYKSKYEAVYGDGQPNYDGQQPPLNKEIVDRIIQEQWHGNPEEFLCDAWNASAHKLCGRASLGGENPRASDTKPCGLSTSQHR